MTTYFPKLRNALRLADAMPESDQRSMIRESLTSILDYMETTVPHGDIEYIETVGRNVASMIRRRRYDDAVIATMNARMDIAAQADETYCPDEPHGCRMPMGGER